MDSHHAAFQSILWPVHQQSFPTAARQRHLELAVIPAHQPAQSPSFERAGHQPRMRLSARLPAINLARSWQRVTSFFPGLLRRHISSFACTARCFHAAAQMMILVSPRCHAVRCKRAARRHACSTELRTLSTQRRALHWIVSLK